MELSDLIAEYHDSPTTGIAHCLSAIAFYLAEAHEAVDNGKSLTEPERVNARFDEYVTELDRQFNRLYDLHKGYNSLSSTEQRCLIGYQAAVGLGTISKKYDPRKYKMAKQQTLPFPPAEAVAEVDANIKTTASDPIDAESTPDKKEDSCDIDPYVLLSDDIIRRFVLEKLVPYKGTFFEFMKLVSKFGYGNTPISTVEKSWETMSHLSLVQDIPIDFVEGSRSPVISERIAETT